MNTMISGLKAIWFLKPNNNYKRCLPGLHLLFGFRTLLSFAVSVCAVFVIFTATETWAATRYVSVGGSDSGNTCTNESSPCQSIARGISQMSGGDTLIVGDGSYHESIAGSAIPSGSAGAYTTVRAANLHGVTVTGSVAIGNRYIKIDGLKINGNGANPVLSAYNTDHVKLMRCAVYGAANADNVTVIDVTASSYVLVEECWAWGTGRYKFLAYWSDHVIFRRNVGRHDYKGSGLQCAIFCNYDSVNTVWQNNIALDSDTANCGGGLYGGFFFENKDDHASDTSQQMNGNFIINISNSAYSAGFYPRVSGTLTVDNMVIYGAESGAAPHPGPSGDATPHFYARNWTIGGLTGNYDGQNGDPAGGTGLAQTTNYTNAHIADNYIKNSILFGNASYGIADYTVSNNNVFYNNTKGNTGGSYTKPSIGANSTIDKNPSGNGLLYLPRIEAGSWLKTAGENGGQAGAEVMYKVGVSGALFGETGYNSLTSDPLWPFPNEALIKSDMASYSGPGASGARGFCAGNSLNGTPQTLTKYIWELLGNQIPADIYASGPIDNSNIAPFVSDFTPTSGSNSFYKDSNIVFHLIDADEGVDSSSIVMTVNGQAVAPAITGNSNDYTVTYDPPGELSGNVVVTINAKDLASPANTMTQKTFSFSVNNSLRLVGP